MCCLLEESSEQKLSDLVRCRYGPGLADGENTMNDDEVLLSRIPFSRSDWDGVDGAGDLMDMDCIKRCMMTGELAAMFSSHFGGCCLENAVKVNPFLLLPALCVLSSLVTAPVAPIALEVPSVVYTVFGTARLWLPSVVETIVWAPRFFPRLDSKEEEGLGKGLFARFGRFFLGWRRKLLVDGTAATPGDRLIIELLSEPMEAVLLHTFVPEFVEECVGPETKDLFKDEFERSNAIEEKTPDPFVWSSSVGVAISS